MDTGLCMYAAVQGLLGVLYYKTSKMRDALASFEHVYERDDCNLNALEHCAFIYEKLCRDQDARDMRKKIEQVFHSECYKTFYKDIKLK